MPLLIPLGMSLERANKKNTNKLKIKLINIFKYFDLSLMAISKYLKYSFLFILLSALIAPYTGIYSIYAPPATLIFAFLFKNIYLKSLTFISLSIWYLIDYVGIHYGIPVRIVYRLFGFDSIVLAIYPLLLICIASFLALQSSKRIRIRKIYRDSVYFLKKFIKYLKNKN